MSSEESIIPLKRHISCLVVIHLLEVEMKDKGSSQTFTIAMESRYFSCIQCSIEDVQFINVTFQLTVPFKVSNTYKIHKFLNLLFHLLSVLLYLV